MLLLKYRYEWSDVKCQTKSTKYGTKAKVYTLSGINAVQQAAFLCICISNFTRIQLLNALGLSQLHGYLHVIRQKSKNVSEARQIAVRFVSIKKSNFLSLW